MIIRKIANWLKNLITRPTKTLNQLEKTLDLEDYEQFLLEVLQVTEESNADLQAVYPVLAANIDKLNDIFAKLLRDWATNTFAEATSETAEYIAKVIFTFSNRIQSFPLGNKASNMEIAITGYEIVLTIYTRADFPQNWATTQNNLGTAYLYRIRGNKAENLELAITAFSVALQIYTCADFPQDWATTQNNLGIAYLYRIRGDKAENLETAITAFSPALEIRTRADFPQDWGMTQNNLGTAYRNRIRGDKAENLELAITAFSAALEILTRADFPQDWGMTQNNLGTTYSDRIKGDKAENLETAIAAYSAALQIYTRKDFPQNWATTQNNLGIAYRDRIRGDKAENLEIAIAAYSAALEIRTRADFPQDWGMTQNNLGTAYSDRIRGDKAENLELAIAAYSAALEIRTRADFPQDWATTQNNLGIAYSDRIRGDKAENLELAIAAYSAALQIYTRKDFPQDHAKTLLNLGILYQDSKQFTLAESTFASAIDTVESLRGEIVSGEESKRKQAEEWNKLYPRMVEVCLELGKETIAIEYIERSKTRNLVELILGDIPFTPIQYSEIQNLVDNETVIIQFYIFNNCFRAFIITQTNDKPIIWQSTNEDLEKLKSFVANNYLKLYYFNKDQWIENLNNQLIELGQILNLNQILSLVPSHYQKLILIPHRFLHLLPIHALPIQESYLIDLFPKGVGYAPSCQILRQVQNRQHNHFQSFFAVQTPTEDLYEKDLGAVTAIQRNFCNSFLLEKDNAKKSELFSIDEGTNQIFTKEALLKANCVFFSCHGKFDLSSPMESALQLANENLTLADIINHLKLDNCRLVTLAACETAVIDFTNTSDEYIGLSSGFLLAGSNNVVSSLWTVRTDATALLMIKFYEELRVENNILVALATSQRWLRDTTVQEFKDWLSNSSLTIGWQIILAQIFDKIAQDEGDNAKPFASPYYWSAFCAIGKGV